MNRTTTKTKTSYSKPRTGMILPIAVLCLFIVFVIVGIGSSAWNIHLRQDSLQTATFVMGENATTQLSKYVNNDTTEYVEIKDNGGKVVSYPAYEYDKNSHTPKLQSTIVDDSSGDEHSRELPTDWFTVSYTLLAKPDASDNSVWNYESKEKTLDSVPVEAGIYRYTVKPNDNAGKYKDYLGSASVIFVIQPKNVEVWILSDESIYGNTHNPNVIAEGNKAFLDSDFEDLKAEHTDIAFRYKDIVSAASDEDSNLLHVLDKTSIAGEYEIIATDISLNYDITYKLGKRENVNAPIVEADASDVVDFTINKRQIQISFDKTVSLSKVYGDEVDVSVFYKQLQIKDENNNIRFTFENGNYISTMWNDDDIKDVISLSSSVSASSPAGNYEIVPEVISNNYEASINLDTRGLYVVTKATLTLTANDTDVIYGEEAEYSVLYSGFVNGDDESDLSIPVSFGCDYAVGKPANSTFTITPVLPEQANYLVEVEEGTLTVLKRALTVEIKGSTSVYGDEITTGILQSSITNGTVYGDDIPYTLSTTASSSSPVGNYSVSVVADNDNYDITCNNDNGKLHAITKANLTVTAEDKTISYGEETPIFTSIIEGAKNGDTFEISYTCAYTQGEGAGTYAIIPSVSESLKGEAPYKNYDIIFANGTLTVEQKTIELEWVEMVDGKIELTYNGSVQTPTARSKDHSIECDFVVSIISEGENAGRNVGKYIAEARISANSNYILPENTTVEFTIVPRVISIEWSENPDDFKFEYDGNNHGPIPTVSNIIEGDDCSFTFEGDASEVGTHFAKISDLTNPNYALPDEAGTFEHEFEIVPKVVTLLYSGKNINETPITFAYNKTARFPTLSSFTLSGVLEAEKSSVTISMALDIEEPSINVGEYFAIMTLNGAKAGNYALENNRVPYKITPVTLTVKVANPVYNGHPQKPIITFTGMVANSGDQVSAVVAVVDADGNVIEDPINAGAYKAKITELTGTSAKNYVVNATYADSKIFAFSITKATLNVTPKSVHVEENDPAPTSFEVIYDGFVNGEDESVILGYFTFTCTYKQGSALGRYNITISKYNGTAPTNYTLKYLVGYLYCGSVIVRPTVVPMEYNGEEQTFIPKDFDPEQMTIVGNVQTDAGTYTATISLNQEMIDGGFTWDDLTTDPIELTWKIDRKKIPYPVDEFLEFVYDKEYHSYTLPEGYDESWVTLSGTIEHNTVGNKTVYITPTDNYQWENGQITQISRVWKIVKATMTLPDNVPYDPVNGISFITEFEYDGTPHSPLFKDYDEDAINEFVTYWRNLGATVQVAIKNANGAFSYNNSYGLSRIDAGEYQIKLYPGSSCTWPDGTVTTYTQTWIIKQKELTFHNSYDFFEINLPSDCYTWQYVDEYVTTTLGIEGIVGKDEVSIFTKLLTNGNGLDYTLTTDANGTRTYGVVLGDQYTKMGITADVAIHNFIGSTYRGVGFTLGGAKFKNYYISEEIQNKTYVLKYKSVLVGSTYYTIEDALHESGDVIVPIKEYWTNPTPNDYSSTTNFFSKYSLTNDDVFMITDYSSRKAVYVDQFYINRYDVLAERFTNMLSDVDANYLSFLEQAGTALTNNINLIKGSNGASVNNTVLFKINNGTYSMVHNPSGSDYDFNTIIARLVGLDSASTFNNKAKAIVNEFKSNSAKVSSNGYAADRLRYNGTIYTDSGIFIIPYKFKSNKANVDVYALMFVTEDGSMYVLLSHYENAYKTANMNNVMNLSSSAAATITITGRKGMYFNKTISQTMTTFTGLSFHKAANFTNYSDEFAYSHSSRIFLKSTADGTNGYSTTSINNSVLSCLIIPGEVNDKDGNVIFPGITLNLTGDIIVPGVITGTGSVSDRAVLVNNGTINQNKGTIYSYGYIKGDGYINLASGAKAVEVFRIYDWLGGANSLGVISNNGAKNVFPFNAYSLHNISCHAIINYGATYYARFLATTTVVNFEEELLIVGTSGALFNVTSNGSYIDKYALPPKSQPNSTVLDTIAGANQGYGQRDIIKIHGDCLDGTISVKQGSYTIDASKSRPIPLTYMEVLVAEGTLTLNNISYKFNPGASLTVAENAKLSVGNGVTMFFYSLEQCIVDSDITASNYTHTPFVSATGGYVVDRNDAYLCVNGNATFNSGSSFGGLVTSGTAGARLELNGASEATIYKITSISYSKLGSTVKQAQTSCASKGNVLGIPDTRITTGSYISSPYGDEFVWGATKADIVFDKNYSDSGESSVIKTLTNKDMPYTLIESDRPANPTRTYYTLETDSNGSAVWYSDPECTQVFNIGDETYRGLVLYAHWIPIEYTVKYGYVYKDGLTASQVNKNVPTETFVITAESGNISDNLIDPSIINVVSGFTFYGWFTTTTCANKVDDALDLLKEATINTSDNSVTIYGSWEIYLPSFTVAFETGSGLEDGFTFPEGYPIDVADETVKISEQGTWQPTADFSNIKSNKEIKYYFGGWYLDKECTNSFTSFNGMTIEEKSTVTLYSKWNQKNKLDVTVFGVTADELSIYYVSGDTFTVPDPKSKGLNYDATDYVYATFSGGSISPTAEYTIGSKVTLTNETMVYVYKLTRYQVNVTLSGTTINSLTFTGHYSEDGTNVTNGTKQFGSLNASKSPWFYVYDGNITNITFKYDQNSNQSFKVNGNNYTSNSGTSVPVNGNNITINGSADSGSTTCLAAGTMFLMPDGTQKKVEDLTVDDYILVFNHETGRYESAKIMFIDYDGWDYWEIMELFFADGTSVKVIYEHGFFDLTENKYVYFDAYNYEQYLGHEFATTTWNGYEYVTGRTTLINVKIYTEFTGCYSPTTVYHLNVVVNGLMSMPGGIEGMFNFFDYDPKTLAYDQEAMQKDIETYGLLPYEFFEDYFSYGVYCMFPAQYVGISLSKGLMTEEYLMYLIERYIDGFNLEDGVEKEPDQNENPSPPATGIANPLANVVIPPSTSSSSGGANSDGSNDDDNE